jgi:D-sedoheptulose 7-phosphate isomerase
LNFSELIKEHRLVLNACEALTPQINKVAEVLKQIQDSHGKVIICGNGGSFAHAQHFAAELVVRYRKNREPMRAIALGSNAAISTSICNDLNPEDLFVRECGAVLDVNDCLLVFSTSGKSKNVLRVLELARSVGVPTLGITGMNGMASLVDHEIRVPSDKTAIIQQIHTIVIHGLCELLDA